MKIFFKKSVAALFALLLFSLSFALEFPKNLEIPRCAAEKHDGDHFVSRKKFYTICYRESFEQAEWAAYVLTRENLQKNAERKNNFRADPFIPSGSAQISDYYKSGFDRGHLAPAADFAFSDEAMSETFFLSNMSPQKAAFNRGIWARLESKGRDWARQFGRLYVVTGPVLEKSEYQTVGQNKVAVPEFFYKAFLAESGGKAFAIAFILPNAGSKESVESFAVSIDYLEERTGIDFFHLLDDETERKVESKVRLSPWF